MNLLLRKLTSNMKYIQGCRTILLKNAGSRYLFFFWKFYISSQKSFIWKKIDICILHLYHMNIWSTLPYVWVKTYVILKFDVFVLSDLAFWQFFDNTFKTWSFKKLQIVYFFRKSMQVCKSVNQQRHLWAIFSSTSCIFCTLFCWIS